MTPLGLSRPSSLPVKQRQPSALFLVVASRFGKRRRLNEPRFKLFWETMAVAASMLMFAALRPSTTAVIAGDTGQSTRIYLKSEALGRTDLKTRFQSTEVSDAAEPQYSMARDFTNHSKSRVRSASTTRKSEVTDASKENVIRTRVVYN
jgi:hypothetical protein